MAQHFTGWYPTPPDVQAEVEKMLAANQGSPEFGDLAHGIKGFGADIKLATPYKCVQEFSPDAFEDESQTTGDCTSHGTRNSHDISRAFEIVVQGQAEAWLARGATEPIYGMRGHRGQGMNVGMAVKWTVNYGLMFRKKYPFVDLSEYNSNIGASWGGSGCPADVKSEAKKHPCKYWSRIRSVEEARDALAAGMGITCGSNYGNDGRRDSRGIARWNDGWNHCMAWGASWEDDDLYFLVLNSWGVWNEGGHPEWGPIPGGSFLIPSDDAAKMISQGECYAIGDVTGPPPPKLPDYGTSAFL